MKVITIKEGEKEIEVNQFATIFISPGDSGKVFTVSAKGDNILIREVSGDDLIISPTSTNSILIK